MTRLTYPRTFSECADARYRTVEYLPPGDPERLHRPFKRGE
jgi:hypothetical protein